MINVIIVFLFTSLLHETEQFVQELSSPRIGVDFVQLQHWQINKFNDGIRSNLIVDLYLTSLNCSSKLWLL